MLRVQTQRKTLILLAAFGISTALSAQARADFAIGAAANYALIAGPQTKSIQLSNSTYNGNVGEDNTTANVQFSSGTINGNFDFAGTAPASIGGGTLTGSIRSNIANVSSAYNTIANLSSTFAGEAGTSFSGSGTLNATSGNLVGGNYVFTTAAGSFLQGGTLTINGAANQYVVVNVTGQSNVQLKNALLLTGGIGDDHVFINITGTGQQIGGNTNGGQNGGAVNGIIVALNDRFNIDNTVIDGRVIGGSNQDFQIVSGMKVTPPPPGVVITMLPEPTSVVGLMSLAGIGLIGLFRRSRRS